jgi:uncharacterized phage protein gp47/JayE
MPYVTKSPEQILAEVEADMEVSVARVMEARGREVTSEAIARAVRSPNGMLGALCRVYALGIFSTHQHHAWNGDQVVADTAEFETLKLKAAAYDIFQRPATRAIGRATLTGEPGTAIPQGLELRSAAGLFYETVEASAIGAEGAATVEIRAVLPGREGNASADTVLALVSPLAGLSPQTAIVDESGLSGGAPIESRNDFLDRYIARKREVPQGGAAHDYPRWVFDQFPASHVKTVRLKGENRDITVGVVIAMGTKTAPRAPTPTESEAISRYLGSINGPDGLRPVTADVLVLPAVITPLSMTIEISPDTPGVRAAVTAAFAAFMAREARIGERLSISRLSEAISAAPGEHRHFLMEPARDVLPAMTTLLTPGEITWVAG